MKTKHRDGNPGMAFLQPDVLVERLMAEIFV